MKASLCSGKKACLSHNDNKITNQASYNVKLLSKYQAKKHITSDKEYDGEAIMILPSTSRITLAIISTICGAYFEFEWDYQRCPTLRRRTGR